MKLTFATAYPTLSTRNSTSGLKLAMNQTFVTRDSAMSAESCARGKILEIARTYVAPHPVTSAPESTSAENYPWGKNLTILRTYVAPHPATSSPKSARGLNLATTYFCVDRYCHVGKSWQTPRIRDKRQKTSRQTLMSSGQTPMTSRERLLKLQKDPYKPKKVAKI